MEERFIMTAFGKDRPGIVADVTQLIYENGCNLEDSTMTKLSDEFAMIFLFSGREEGLEDQLSRECRRLEIEKGISAFLRPVRAEEERPQAAFSTHTLNVEGIDQAGIVYKVSKYLAGNNINIATLVSQKTFSAESGEGFYTMEMQVQIPEGTSMDNLDEGLAQVGDELNVEITME